RVVLDRDDLAVDALQRPLEVDDPVAALGATAAVARRDAAVVVAAAALTQRDGERFLRLLLGDLGEGVAARVAPAGRGWAVLSNGHLAPPRLHAFEDLDALAGRDRHDSLLPRLRHPERPADAALLRRDADDVHRQHVHLEDLFDGVLDLRLVRAPVDLEGVLVEPAQHRVLLGDQWLYQHFVDVHSVGSRASLRSWAIRRARGARAGCSAGLPAAASPASTGPAGAMDAGAAAAAVSSPFELSAVLLWRRTVVSHASTCRIAGTVVTT